MTAHQRLAGAMRALADRRIDTPTAGLTVISLDTWAVQHAPDLIREAEERDGVPHWTTRARAHAMERLVGAGLRHDRREVARG